MKYLHVIYKARESGARVRSVDIARELGVTKASVSRMLKLLAGFGLINTGGQGSVTLTPEGGLACARIHGKVTQIHSFFHNFLGLDTAEALENTYAFVCGFSERCVESLAGKGWGLSGQIIMD